MRLGLLTAFTALLLSSLIQVSYTLIPDDTTHPSICIPGNEKTITGYLPREYAATPVVPISRIKRGMILAEKRADNLANKNEQTDESGKDADLRALWTASLHRESQNHQARRSLSKQQLLIVISGG